MCPLHSRRDFLRWLGATVVVRGAWATPAGLPTDNPSRRYKLDWTDQIRWDRVVSVADVPGASADDRIARAQKIVAEQGGGVVYLPAGTYRLSDSIRLLDGVVLRGEPPKLEDARQDAYSLGTRLEFPLYEFRPEGNGTPIETAFKGIVLDNPSNGAHCGLVHLHIERGHVRWLEAEGHQSRPNRIVYGCIFRNAAVVDPAVPDLSIGQHPWQRFTARHAAAIEIEAAGNILVANNRLPKSGEANFVMKGYRLLQGKTPIELDEVIFDYDNRPGIYVNHFAIGGAGAEGPDGTPETHPHGFRRGIVIADNYIFQTGRMAIGFCGDGVVCRGNVIRFARDVVRPTVTGRSVTAGTSTNDNRAVEMRGWRWVVEDNDYEVYRNWAYGRKYLINDGEGLMHEDHCNSTVLDSVLRRNRGNAYISIYKTGGIDGLLVEDNEVPHIMVVADRNRSRHPIRRVRIVGNVTEGGIHVGGEPSEDVVVERNRCRAASPAKILNQARARLADNINYVEDPTPPKLRT